MQGALDEHKDSLSDVEPVKTGPSNSKLDQSTASSNTHVTIKLGSTTDSFERNALLSFEFFRSMFSDRWNSHSNQPDSTTIDIFGTSENTTFSCKHLHLLIAARFQNHIPFDSKLTSDDIDSFCQCFDFFVSESQEILHNLLISYFESSIPSIDFKTRQNWLLEAKHPAFRAALLKFVKTLSEEQSAFEHDCLLGTDDNNITVFDIKYDPDTAAKMFRKIFKIDLWISDEPGPTRKTLAIVNFDRHRNCWNKLAGSFDINKYWHFFGPTLSYLIKVLEEQSGPIEITGEETHAFMKILEHIIDCFCTGTIDLGPNKPPNITLLSTMKSCIHLIHKGTAFGNLESEKISKLIAPSQLLDVWEKEEFVQLLLDSFYRYCMPDDAFFGQLDDREARNARAHARHRTLCWWNCVEYLLSGCSPEWLVYNADDWFNIMVGSTMLEVKSAMDRLFKSLVPKLNTQLSVKFAFCLAKQVRFMQTTRGKERKDCLESYLNFIEQQTGMSWKLDSKKPLPAKK